MTNKPPTFAEAFRFRAKAITQRKSPLHYGIVCRPNEDYPGFLRSHFFQERLEKATGWIADFLVAHWVPPVAASPRATPKKRASVKRRLRPSHVTMGRVKK